jgi:hypothetical protein
VLTRDRDRRRALAIGAGLALAALCDRAWPLEHGPIVSAFFGFIIAGIVAAFQYIAGHAVTLVVTLAQVAVMIGQAIAHFAILVAGVFARVASVLAHFWSGTLRPFISYVYNQALKLHAWLVRTFEPIIKYLEKIRQTIAKIYDRWFRPILDVIDTTRRILQFLALVRIPFARELDRYLAELEARILWPIQYAYAKINEALYWINRIVTFDGYFQRLTLIASLIKYERDTLAIWWTSIHRPLTGARRDDYTRPPVQKPIEQVRQELVAYVRDGAGPDRARIDEHAADMRLRLARV